MSTDTTTTATTGGTGPGHRSVRLTRTTKGEFDVTNVRGGTMHLGTGEGADFTPVELLLAAIAGCSAVDVDFITTKKVEPVEFTIDGAGDKISDPTQGNIMEGLEVTFTVRFPDGEDGQRATERVPRAIEQSHDRLCTVSRTVQVGTPITMTQG